MTKYRATNARDPAEHRVWWNALAVAPSRVPASQQLTGLPAHAKEPVRHPGAPGREIGDNVTR